MVLLAPEDTLLPKYFQIAIGKASFEVGDKMISSGVDEQEGPGNAGLEEILKGTTPAETTGTWTPNSNFRLVNAWQIDDLGPSTTSVRLLY